MALPSVSASTLLHLDAALGVTKDGSDLVSLWEDQSSEGTDVSQGTPANQPTWYAAPTGFNGNPAILFSGGSDVLDNGTADTLQNRSDITVMAVVRSSGTMGALIEAANFRISLRIYPVATKQFTAAAENGGGTARTVSLGTNSAVENTSIVCAARVGYNLGTLKFEDLTSGTSGTSSAYTANNSENTTHALRVGYGALYGSDFNGYISELVIYDDVLSDGDVSTLESYFNTKYGITPAVSGTGASTVEFDASGTGLSIIPITGTGAATVEFDAGGTGTVHPVGSGAATVEFDAGGAGTIHPVGSGAATLSDFSSFSFGTFTILVTGTGAATFTVHGGLSSSPVQFRYKSRPIFYAEERDKAAEMLFANVHCEFNDVLGYDVTLWTDKLRYKSAIDYLNDAEVVNNQASAGRPYFRKLVEIVPAPGGFGTYFQVEIDKDVHHIQGFEFTGTGMYLAGRPGITPEFVAGNSTLANGWE